MTHGRNTAQSTADDAEFRAAEVALLAEQSRIGAWLMLVLIPAGVSLDYFVYEDRLLEFASYRGIADLFVVAALILHRHRIAAQHPRLGIMLWVGAAVIMISYMIYVTEGARSSYYVGLVLTLLAIGILLPLRVGDVAGLGTATLGLYALACAGPGAPSWDTGALFRSNYFLALAVIIALTAVHFGERRRRNEFALRREIESRNRRLAELDQMKSRFFANISHELRTPLTLILAPIQELKTREHLDPTLAAALTMIETSALRLLRLVNELLDLVRFEQGTTRIETKPVALDAIVKSLVEQMHFMSQQRGISLTADIEDAPLIIAGDEAAIERIVLNLVGNALKFTDTGGAVTVRLNARAGRACLEVWDTGIGMPPADAQRIFDRFQQLESSPGRRRQGIGLGLALVKELVNHHKGSIEVDTAIARGTTMRVYLPLAPSGLDVAAPCGHGVTLRRPTTDFGRQAMVTAGALAGEPLDAQPAGNPDAPKVLVVEDEPELRRFLINVLAREYSVYHAADGPEALRLISVERPCIVILDLMLPTLDGLEVCRRVKEDDNLRSTKVLLLTARIDEQAKLEALSNGADDFLTKPFSTIEVVTRLRNLHRAAQLEARLRDQNDELRTTLRRLRTAEAELFQREKLSALGTMAAGLLHEINNPLNYAGIAVAIAQRHAAVRSDPQLSEMLADIDDGVKRVQRIVSDLRTFSTARPVTDMRVFNVASMVQQAARFTATELSGHALSVDIDPCLAALGNDQQLSQVVVNLLLNAARACRDVKPRGQIAVAASATAGRISISVTDNGVGIAPERQSRIFDPFYTTSDVGAGMGLGLSVSLSIVARHGGRLTFTSETNVGSTFTFDVAHHHPAPPQELSYVTASQL